ncbi:MAG: hypothetical protein ABSH53_22130 [Holophaga sp.]|jgi:hypothetical protein
MKLPSPFRRFLARVALVVGGLIFAVYFISVEIRYREFSRELASLGQVFLTDYRADVMYRLGSPDHVLGTVEQADWGPTRRVFNLDAPAGDVNHIPEGTKLEEYSSWAYEIAKGKARLDIDFDSKGLVESVGCFCSNEDPSAWGPVAGIRNGDSEEKVLGLGNPTTNIISYNFKTIDYSDIGIRFQLKKGKVYMVTLHHPKKGEWAVFWRFLHTLP